MLVLAAEPALGYFRALAASLSLENRVICMEAQAENALAVCLESCKKSGPFRRIYLVADWDGGEAHPLRRSWEELRAAFPPPSTVALRLLCCRPSFDLWFLLHFEEPGASADNGETVGKRVERLLGRGDAEGPEGLARNHPERRDEAIRRGMSLTLERQLNGEREELFPGGPGVAVHELVTCLLRLVRRTPTPP